MVDLFIITFAFIVTTLTAVIYTIKHFKPRYEHISEPSITRVEQTVKTKVLVKEAVPREDSGNSMVSAQLIAARTEIEKIKREIDDIIREAEDEN